MAEQFNTLQMLQGSNMVGHDVLVEGNTLTPIDGTAVGAIDLAGRAESVKVEILSPGGQVIDTIDAGALDAGRNYFNWDASAYHGTGSPSFRVTATTGGKAIEATTLAQDKVVSVGLENGAMTVQLQGRGAASYSSIKAIL
jgi:flagellar basal-body rod modification protein FlgD